MKQPRILVVDDTPANLTLLSSVLEFEGYDVTQACDAESAQKLIADAPPDLILMDVGLPGMDGLSLTRQLKADPTTQHILVAVVTAAAMKGDEEKARAAGCDAYITKPIDTRALPIQVAALLGRAPTGGRKESLPLEGPSPITAGDGFLGDASPRRILVVDDLSTNRLLLREILEAVGHDVFEAADGAEALAMLERVEAEAVISDALMPNMDGFRLCLELRKSEKLKRLPFVIYTSTYNSAGDRDLAEKVGADAYLIKPAPANAIFAALARAMHKAEARPAAAPTALAEEFTVIKQYNAALVAKLEERNEDLSRAVAELRESEAKFRQVVESINEVFWMTDPAKQTMLYISPAYETIWGRTCESLRANPLRWVEAIHPEDRARVLEAATTNQASGNYDEVYRIVRPDGSQRWIRDRAFPVRNENGDIFRMVGTAEDVTDRKRAEIRASVQHAVTAALSDGAPVVETAHRVLEIICRQFEWTMGDLWMVDRPTKTLRCVDIWHPPSGEFQAFSNSTRVRVFANGEGLPGKVWSAKAPHWILDVSADSSFCRQQVARALCIRGAIAFPIKNREDVLGVIEFFSVHAKQPDTELLSMFEALGAQLGQFIERKQLEEKFRQAQKMEAIGTLAGGIAHDFNNVLAAITGYTELAKMQTHDNPEVLEYLSAVAEGSARAADLVRQILAFSRLQEQQRKPMQLWPVVDEALKLLRATIPATIEFDTSLVRRGPLVLGDPTQIHQIVMNLATNAAYSMKEGPGRLGITLEHIEVDDDLAALHPGLHPGRYMRLGVSDTGHGMDQATLSRIFDPFFTTKAPGEGTGLGLAVVHGIVQSHDGVITVYSQPGKGTQFHLYFPVHVTDVATAAVETVNTPRGQGERILFIDDEMPLALMGKKILERLGYVVDCETLPSNAVALIRASPDKYDLVVTDLTMPGMNGTSVAEQLLKVRADLPVILTTGYSASLTPEKVRLFGVREMLLKPLTFHALGEAVHRTLAGKHTSS